MPYFERFVSRRYLFSRARRALVSIITFISIAGVAVGVAALIIVIGVIEGIDKDIFGKIVQIYPHLKITDKNQKVLADTQKPLDIIMKRKEVAYAEPSVSRQVLFSRIAEGSETRVPGQLVATEELGKGRIYDIPNTRDGAGIRLGDKELLLGAPLEYHLGAQAGDTILVTTGMLVRTANDWHPRMRELTEVGHSITGVWDFDQVTAFVSPETAREVFGTEGKADFIHVKMKDPFAAAQLKNELQAELGPEYEIKTWEEENGEFFQALKLEKMGLTVILLLVVIVASFNIIGTLILLVIEKKPEIGILKAIGSSDAMIHRTFLSAGMTIGTIGTAAGLALGLGGCYLITKVSLGMPPSAYNMNHLPVLVKPLTVAMILAASMTISLLAAYFPAAQAARLDPVEALRHD